MTAGTLYYWTKPLASTRWAKRHAYQTSKLFAQNAEFKHDNSAYTEELIRNLL